MMPLLDKVHQTRTELKEKMAVMLGGRAAEELIFHELTGGASSDIDRVTSVARKMVVYLGMSDLGPIDFGPQYDTSEYGMRYYDGATLSDKMQEAVDGQVKKFIDEAYILSKKILLKERSSLEKVAAALMEKETLDGDEFLKFVGKPKAERKKNSIT